MTNPYAPPLAEVRDVMAPAGFSAAAGRSTPFWASMLDGLIFAVMVYAPLIVTAAMADPESASGEPTTAGLLAVFGAGAGFIAWAWLTIHYMRRNSQSIGKEMTGIKVVRSDGSPVSLSRLILQRNVVTWILSLIPLYGIVDALFIFSESRQCLHDKIADTIVVTA